MKLSLAIFFLAISLVLAAVWAWQVWMIVHKRRAAVDLVATLIHLGDDRIGCPAGWTRIPKVFQRADGTLVDGCIKDGIDPGSFVIDRLDPGESVSIGVIEIPLPHDEREGKT